jgi:molecular chaperone GrpE
MSEHESPGFQVIDKRHFADLDRIDMATVPEEKPRYPSYVEELMARMAETERKFQEKKRQIDEEISRSKARLEADYERKLELEKQKLALPFLEVLDNLQRAVDAASQSGDSGSLLEGIRMTVNLFRSNLLALGVEPIAAVNRPFDPNLQQAVGTVEVTEAGLDGMVVEEIEPGYCMNGRLLRPARVRVARLQ